MPLTHGLIAREEGGLEGWRGGGGINHITDGRERWGFDRLRGRDWTDCTTYVKFFLNSSLRIC